MQAPNIPTTQPGRCGPSFRTLTVAVAVAFATAVAALLLADLVYIVEFALHGAEDQVKDVALEIFSKATRQEILLSLGTATLTTFLALLVAVPAGYALSRHRIPCKVLVDTLVDAAIVLPPLILGVSLLVLFSLIRRGAENLGTPAEPNPILQGFYDFFVYQKPGIVLAQFFVSTAFCIRALRAAFDSADRRVEDVALTLGCTPFGAFWRTALPQAGSGLLAGAVMAWSYAVGLFAPVAIFAGTVRGRTAVLPTRTYLEVSVGHIEIALVLTVLMAGIAMALLIALKALVQRQGKTGGAP
jgi:molybdate transport system permease protein